MDNITPIIKTVFGVIGGVIGFLFGEVSGMFIALLVFMVIDYITGVICAIIEKNLSSEVGFKGLAKKFIILAFIIVANMLDTYVLGGNVSVFKSAVICFYLANEGLSILENGGRLGMPYPQKLKDILEQLKHKEDNNE